MPNALSQFNFQTNAVRTIAENGEIWFVAKDISKALDYSQSSTAAVIFQSDKPKALPFQKWLAG